jgi:superfamily II DNA or RNA helicase
MPTGAGKTTVALKILSELKVKTLILVHRRELVKQWEKAIKLELGYEAGGVGSGVENWKDITIAMIPTLFRRKDLKLNHDLLILDECFPYETNVITDRGVLKIGEIVENALDVKVLTHTGAFKRILNHIRKPKPSVMVRVIHEFGSFECTETHKILTNKGWMESRRLLRGDVVYYTQDGKCAYVPSSCKYSGSYGLHEVQDDTGLYVYDIEVEDDHSYTANGVVVHNCHHTPARSAYKLSMACNAAYRFGLSATPHRPDGADLKLFAAVGGIIYKSTPEELVRLGRLARPEFMFLQTSYVRNIYQGMPFHKVYTLGITANEDRNNRITGIAEKLLSEGYIVYIHVEEVAHGRYLAGHIEGAEFVSGVTKKSDRDSIIGRFSSGKLKCLVSTLLGEGVDIPSITAIIMAGGKKTEIGCIQKIGRALRAAPGKEKAIIVDMMDKGIYLSDHWQERYKAYKEYYGVYCPDLKVG